MPKAGTYTALQQLKPITTDFGKITKDEEELKFKYREEKRLVDEKAKEAKDKITFDQQGNIVTGVDSLDFALYKGISNVNKTNYIDWERAQNDPVYAGSDEYKLKSKNRNNFSKNLKVYTDVFSDFATKINGMGADLSGWNGDLREQIGGFFVKERVEFLENEFGEPVAKIALHDPETDDGYKRDANGEIMTKVVGLPEVLKGLGDYDIVPQVNITEMAQTIAKELGTNKLESGSSYKQTTAQTWESKKEDVIEAAKGDLGSYRNPSALAKRIWSDKLQKDKKDWSEEAFNTVVEEYVNLIKPYYDESLEVDYNLSGINAEAARRAEGDKNVVVPAVVAHEDTGKPKIVKVPNTKIPAYAVSFGNGVITEKEEARTTAITNVYITEDGRVFGDKTVAKLKLGGSGEPTEGSETSDYAANFLANTKGKPSTQSLPKGWEMEDEEGVELSTVELTNLAKNRNVKDEKGNNFLNAKEFKDFLKRQYNTMEKNTAADFSKKKKGGATKFNKTKS